MIALQRFCKNDQVVSWIGLCESQNQPERTRSILGLLEKPVRETLPDPNWSRVFFREGISTLWVKLFLRAVPSVGGARSWPSVVAHVCKSKEPKASTRLDPLTELRQEICQSSLRQLMAILASFQELLLNLLSLFSSVDADKNQIILTHFHHFDYLSAAITLFSNNWIILYRNKYLRFFQLLVLSC